MPEKIATLAKILVRIPELLEKGELGLDWQDAAKAKATASKWLRKVGKGALPTQITVLIEIEQRSDDVPDFTDKGTWVGRTDPAYSIEYGAAFLDGYKNWGRGR